MSEKKKCCGECRFSQYSNLDGEWYCTNEGGDYYGIETTYDGNCEDFEKKE